MMFSECLPASLLCTVNLDHSSPFVASSQQSFGLYPRFGQMFLRTPTQWQEDLPNPDFSSFSLLGGRDETEKVVLS